MKPPLWAIAYTAYYGKLFDWRHASADKKRRFAKVARAVVKAGRKKK